MRPHTVLLVEDNTRDVRLMQHVLARLGIPHDVRVVSSGEQALAYLRREDVYRAPDAAPCPDLILLDLELPGMSGHDVLRYCKQDARFKCIPVAVFATSEEPEEVRRAYADGANVYLRKPMEFLQLLSVFKQLNTFWFDLVILPPKG